MATYQVVNKQVLIAKLKLYITKKMAQMSVYAETSYGSLKIPYAIYVHENKYAYHPVGQAKYLEEPARVEAKNIGAEINKAILQTGDIGKGLFAGARYLLAVSQPYVPVDTGALKASGEATLVRERP